MKKYYINNKKINELDKVIKTIVFCILKKSMKHDFFYVVVYLFNCRGPPSINFKKI